MITAAISRLSLLPGDTLVLHSARPLTQPQREHLINVVRGATPPQVPILVLDNNLKLSVLEKGSHLFSDRDAEAVRQAAANMVWHSMRKFDGNPTHVDYHPLNCGCTRCT